MRLLFVGSGEFGIPTLAFLHRAAQHELVAVITQPDRPAGRKRRLTPTPVAQWATRHGLEVLKAEDVNSAEFVTQTRDLRAGASIVIAFGQKLGEPLIAAMGHSDSGFEKTASISFGTEDMRWWGPQAS